jgi:protein disulfide-isomerase A1
MDSPENDLPASVPFRVSGFPTLKFKQAGSREFIDYDGDRSLENLVAFVEKHAKNSLGPKVQVQAEPEKQVPLTKETMPETATPEATSATTHEEHDEL